MIAALAIGELVISLVIVFAFLIAELIDQKTEDRRYRNICALRDQLPQLANVRSARGSHTETLQEIAVGDIAVIRNGGRIPGDGRVSKACSFIDESAITGNSTSVQKVRGDWVYAGTLNQGSELEVCVEKVGLNTKFGKVVEEATRAETRQAPLQTLAERLAAGLVYFTLAAALLTLLLTRDIRTTISVLLVAAASGAATGTALAISAGICAAARLGVVVKGGLYLERLSSVDTLVLDEARSLANIQSGETNCVPQPGVTEEELLSVAASAGRFSEHPVARAIEKSAYLRAIPVPEAQEVHHLSGRGIHCWVNDLPTLLGSQDFIERLGIKVDDRKTVAGGELFVAQGSKLLGKIELSDSPSPADIPAFQRLHVLGIRILLVASASILTTKAIADELGVDEVLKPAAKRRRIRDLQASGHTVAIINDVNRNVSELIEATVAVALGSDTAAVQENSQVVLLGNDLMKFCEVLRVAKRCHQVILFNLGAAIAVNLIGSILAMFGVVNPIMAILIHLCSDLLFLINAARLLPDFADNSVHRKGA